MKPTELFNRKSTPDQARLNPARWHKDVETFGENEFARVLETFENHNETIISYFERRLTNASAGSFNAKVKAFRAQSRGVGDIKSFMFWLATQYAGYSMGYQPEISADPRFLRAVNGFLLSKVSISL